MKILDIYKPQRAKRKKIHRIKVNKARTRKTFLDKSENDFALKASEGGWLTESQIETGRRSIKKILEREGRLKIPISTNYPVTHKGVGARIGKGRGDPKYWVASIRPGEILYEVGGAPKKLVLKALVSASKKIPVRCKISIREERKKEKV